MAGDRQAHFREHFLDVEAADDWRSGSTATACETLLRNVVWIVIRGVLAPLSADVQLQALVGPRELDVVLAEVAGDRATHHVLGDRTLCLLRDRQERRLRGR